MELYQHSLSERDAISSTPSLSQKYTNFPFLKRFGENVSNLIINRNILELNYSLLHNLLNKKIFDFYVF